MNFPKVIYADTDLVCGEEPKDANERYIRANLLAPLIEIVEGLRNERWEANGVRLKDTPEWCAFYLLSELPCDCETLKGMLSTMCGNASKLRDVQAYIQNVVSGLMMRGENQSPLLDDLVVADRKIEEVRQWLLSQNNTDIVDMQRDEFRRIIALLRPPQDELTIDEIVGICERGIACIEQTVPVIVRRDRMESALCRIINLCEAYQNQDIEGQDPEDTTEACDLVINQICEIACVAEVLPNSDSTTP